MHPKRIILSTLLGAALLAVPVAPFGGQASLGGMALAHGGNGGGGGRGGTASSGGQAGGAGHAGMGHAPNQSHSGCGGGNGPYTGPNTNYTSGC